MSIFMPAYEARLTADAVQEVNKNDNSRRRVAELIQQSAGKGRYRVQIADMPQWLWEELKMDGYRVGVLPDGYEIIWDSIDEDLNYIRG
jgi:hypothetical protein